MRSLLLGLDVSPRRMGWGLVDLVSGEPIACGCEAIELPPSDKHPERTQWDRRRVVEALRWLPGYDPPRPNPDVTSASMWLPRELRGEVQAVYIEHPISRFPGMAYDEGRAVGMVHAEVQRRWPHAPVEYLKPAEWRLLAGLKGNASKGDVTLRAIELGFGDEVMEDQSRCLSWVVPGGQDAADAACIAVAGQRRNGENWTRAVERGEAA